MDAEEAFGQVLRDLRHARKLSQEKLALDADIQRNYVSLLELGRNSPSVNVLFKLAPVLGTTPSEMLRATEQRMVSAARRRKRT